MNHSSFIDLKIAHRIMFPRPVSVVCTYDALVGKRWLMRWMGCIPTRKFVSDIALIHDMKHALSHGTNVLLYPEAGYSFDGTATSMPKLAKLCKMLKVPVVYIETKGAYI
jgi:1-acyl-sn-glycerol-3-phosphate acyltransferase